MPIWKSSSPAQTAEYKQGPVQLAKRTLPVNYSRMSSNRIRLILFDVGGVLIELSGLAMFLSWLENRMTTEQLYTF